MTDEEKEKYRGGLIATCKTYCHIDYDDDIEILELMLDTTLDEMTELIPNFDRNNLTSRQKLLAFMSVKELTTTVTSTGATRKRYPLPFPPCY